MPILKSAMKRIRADKVRKVRNLNTKSEIKTLAVKFNEDIIANKKDAAKISAHLLISKLDKAVSHGILHKNTASRKKSRIAIKLGRLK